MTELKDLLTLVGELSPLGLAGMLAYIIYQLVHRKGAVRMISENHLSGLPATLQHLVESTQRIETTLARIEGSLGRMECPFKRDRD